MEYVKSKMRVLYIGAGLGYDDGSSMMLSCTIKELNSIFKDVYILVHDVERNKTFEREFETILYYESYNVIISPTKIIDRLVNYIRLGKAIKSIVVENDIDIVIVFTANKMIITKLALYNWKGILIGSERGAPQTKRKLWIILSKYLFSKYDGLIFQTKKAQNFYGKKIENISTIIPNPYIGKNKDIEPYHGIRKKTIVSAGRLCYDKGYDILISAFSDIVKKYPEYKLLIYGEGPDKKKLEDKITEMKLNNKAFLCGFTENVAKSVKEDGIFVLSSRTEGIPNVLLEVMGVGVPCIATDCASGGPALLLNNNERGLLIKINSVESLVKAISYLIDNSQVAANMGKKAMEVKEEYDYNKIFDQWKKFIMSRISNKN